MVVQVPRSMRPSEPGDFLPAELRKAGSIPAEEGRNKTKRIYKTNTPRGVLAELPHTTYI